MMSVVKTKIILSLFAVFGFVAVLSGQQSSQQTSKPGTETHMSMGDMQKECRRHCSTKQQSVDQLTKRLDEAEQSNDPAKMKSAIGEARQQLNQMSSRMTGCMNKMSMMQGDNMQDMRGMMGGQKQEPPSTKSNEPPK